ncbi:MAG: hypothetical protein JWM19_7881 [Actinomycetia bacterium]|nr:hypothetical protein [Actinomycetes bacterium]
MSTATHGREAARRYLRIGQRPPPGQRLAPASPIPAALIAAVILAGALQRWWVATHIIGTLSSDGAVIGLMALRILQHGQFTAFMWGQSYGGSLEAALTAAVFLGAGVGTSQLLATTALTSALCVIALWRAGRLIVGETAAGIGALVFWVWPATFLWRSLKPGGTYMAGLAIALCAVWALAKIKKGDRTWGGAALAGLWCGLALWSSPMALELLVPAVLWCLPELARLRWKLAAAAAGWIAGWFPSLVFGVTHDWTNLHMPSYQDDLLSGFPSRFGQFFTTEGPIVMGVREEGSLGWLGGPAGQVLAWLGVAALLVIAAAVVRNRAPRCRLPVLTIALLPILYALIPLADHTGQGRYALFAVPMGALLVGVVLDRAANRSPAANPGHAGTRTARRTATIGLMLACALGTAGLLAEPGRQLVAFQAPDVAMPANDAGLLHLLAVHGITDAYSNYWIAYRVTFETGGRATVTPDDYDRYPPIARMVDASPDPAYLFISASRTTAAFQAWCRERAIAYQAWSDDGFTVVRPAAKVTPGMVPATVLG